MNSPSRVLVQQLVLDKKVKNQDHRVTKYKKEIEWPAEVMLFIEYPLPSW